MPDKYLDPVEWEIVRADIAMEKARLKANGDWAKWEEFQRQANDTLAAHRASSGWLARAARAQRRVIDEERVTLWWAARIPDPSWTMAPPRTPRRPGFPLRGGK
jgi:hypothetical protein